MTLWVGNPDGTGFVQLADSYTKTGKLYVAIAPHSGKLVFYYPPNEPADVVKSILDFTVVGLPSVSRKVLPLSNTSLKPSPIDAIGFPYGDIFAALTRNDSFAWSPDGTVLAYASAQDGPSVDLYAYSTVSGTVTRLTSGPGQTIDISWSPDGHYIVSAGAKRMNFGTGGGNGPTLDSIWAIRPDGNDLHTIQTYPGGSEAPPILLGWVNNQAYVEYYGVLGCGSKGLTFVNIQTASHYTIIPGAIGPLAFNPRTGTALILIQKITEQYELMAICGTTPDPGIYLLSVFDSKAPKKISLDPPLSENLYKYFTHWSPEANLFFLASKDGVYTIDSQGKTRLTDIPNFYYGTYYYPSIFPKSSPNGREWAVYYDSGLWIASPDHPIQKIFAGPIDDVLWKQDGSALLFISDNTLYRAAIGEYEPIEIAGPIPPEESSMKWQLSWAMP